MISNGVNHLSDAERERHLGSSQGVVDSDVRSVDIGSSVVVAGGGAATARERVGPVYCKHNASLHWSRMSPVDKSILQELVVGRESERGVAARRTVFPSDFVHILDDHIERARGSVAVGVLDSVKECMMAFGKRRLMSPVLNLSHHSSASGGVERREETSSDAGLAVRERKIPYDRASRTTREPGRLTAIDDRERESLNRCVAGAVLSRARHFVVSWGAGGRGGDREGGAAGRVKK
mmetsp:Transcript_2627/g.4842  ORF Transcript_2627/g.4842 Transcript_2627/m.4842 type:complete len:236 (-) Transcript_2627:233-940(-)